ncbi:MAG: hypothetical protein ACR2F6_01245 [Mycobacteriales bacterium]
MLRKPQDPIIAAGRIYAVAGTHALASPDGSGRDNFALIDGRGGRTTIPAPASPWPAGDAVASPDGHYIATTFANPACPGPQQCLDIWLLDLTSHRWLHLPSMPTAAALKFTGLTWASDGRVVIVGSFDSVGDAIAIWRPGQHQLQLRTIPMPSNRSPAVLAWRIASTR